MHLTLRPKNLERQHQARASPWREPKISKAACQRAPGSQPQRTSWRSSQRWGTRRKVKRWTTNWLRQKSKKHLELLFPLLHFLGGGGIRSAEAAKLKIFFFCSLFSFCLSLLIILRIDYFLGIHILCVCSLFFEKLLGFWHGMSAILASHAFGTLWHFCLLSLLNTTSSLVFAWVSRMPWRLGARKACTNWADCFVHWMTEQ